MLLRPLAMSPRVGLQCLAAGIAVTRPSRLLEEPGSLGRLRRRIASGIGLYPLVTAKKGSLNWSLLNKHRSIGRPAPGHRLQMDQGYQ
jgi:hypothetical protein